jgi:hypothetical protein
MGHPYLRDCRKTDIAWVIVPMTLSKVACDKPYGAVLRCNLRSMTVLHFGASQCLTLSLTLQDLTLEQAAACPSAHASRGLANLTSLRVSVPSDRCTPFHSMTILSGAPKAGHQMQGAGHATPCLTTLAELTRLVLGFMPGTVNLLPFTATQRLVHLGIKHCSTMSNVRQRISYLWAPPTHGHVLRPS